MKDVTDKTLKDTGERMIPAYHKSHWVYAEHVVRYEAAAALAKGKVVLDIASGSGYGTAIMAAQAKQVYGVDVDADAIKYAQKNYGASNITFKLGDGTKIPLPDNEVDLIITCETIEHIKDYKTFMAELKRVLKPDGLLVLSTPNDVEFPETNHYHIHEFERKELEKLVDGYFKQHKSYYQGIWLYNGIFTEEQLRSEWRQPIETMQTAPIGLDKCTYFYMLCSNRKITESIEPLAAISEHWSARRIIEYEQSVRKHMDDQAAIMQHQKNTIKDQERQLKSVRVELAAFKKNPFSHLGKKMARRIGFKKSKS